MPIKALKAFANFISQALLPQSAPHFRTFMRPSTITLIAATAALPTVLCGPLAYALCQTGCNIGAGICYSAAGFTFGTVLAVTAPASILACNALQGACMAACAAGVLFAPTP